MLNMRHRATRVLRLAVVIGLLGALVVIGAHHHDGHAAEGKCALCYFASSLMAPAAATPGGPDPSLQSCKAIEQPSTVSPGLVLAAPCGLRAPPLSL